MKIRLATVAFVAALVAALFVARALPSTGIGLYVRLGLATAILLLPGGAIRRLLGLAGTAAGLAWSLCAIFGVLALTFALGRSVSFALGALAVLGAIAFVLSVMGVRLRRGSADRRGELFARLGVLLSGAVFGIALWHVAGPVSGDGLFHLARVRKLDALPHLSLHAVGEFADGGLHPGYAFPLWHGFLALVARLAGVDPEAVVRHESSLLAGLAFAVAFEAGRALFRHWSGGIAVVAAQVALYGLAPGHGGSFRILALPETASRLLLVPAVFALSFTAVAAPSWQAYATLAAASLALVAIHPTYALFVLVPLGGWLVARWLLTRLDAKRSGGALAAVLVPTLAFVAWLAPVARDTVSRGSKALAGGEHGFAKYPGQLVVHSAHSYSVAPEVLARTGAVAAVALCAVPLAAFAARRRWGAFVLGGGLAVLGLVLIPFIFPRLTDAVSLSQSRRAAGFFPFSFAFAGGWVVASRAVPRWLLLPGSLALGIVLQLAVPGDFGHRLHHGWPALATWIAAGAGIVALALAVLWRRLPGLERRDWAAAAAAVLFVVPVAWHGFSNWNVKTPPSTQQLSSGLLRAIDTYVPRGAVVLSDLQTSYLIGAAAPVYVVANPIEHVADTHANRSHDRRRDVNRYLAHGDPAILRKWKVQFVVVDLSRPHGRLSLPQLYRDARYVLYRVPR